MFVRAAKIILAEASIPNRVLANMKYMEGLLDDSKYENNVFVDFEACVENRS